ncbi:alpha-E domain-containing protein [Kaustia mangrovi]|uniref:Alpha-E domain-containing protein n=1 Tax=Kaustia mangrovi TaxID=2593653 RepID=A0A7S8C0W2_9HYPH|nr:alpha-E domain-containing protein [Kaustia mangrovi]QPC41313.1 alpha-E domain-containing protein [Kaustia mangrovi]
MLSRTANDLFWLARYMERAENMARLLDVGYRMALMPHEGQGHRDEWRSTLASAGCEKGFFARHDTITMRAMIDYMLFDPDNASSVRSCLSTARRNMRAVRTEVTREVWESLNATWLEFSATKPDSITTNALPEFLDWIKERAALFRGVLSGTMLRNDAYFFSHVGLYVERADNTARIVDVKYYILLPENEIVGGGVDNYQWSAILRSVAAHRSYGWVYRTGYNSWNIGEYLILNAQMPRSLAFCYDRITEQLGYLERFYGAHQPSNDQAGDTARLLWDGDMNRIFQNGLHEFLRDFIARNNRLSQQIAVDYHFAA